MTNTRSAPQPLFPVGKVSIAIAGTLVGVGVVGIILGLMAWTSRPAPVTPSRFEDQTPQQLLQDVRSEEREQLSTYGWVDAERGLVRIPIQEAMGRMVETKR